MNDNNSNSEIRSAIEPVLLIPNIDLYIDTNNLDETKAQEILIMYQAIQNDLNKKKLFGKTTPKDLWFKAVEENDFERAIFMLKTKRVVPKTFDFMKAAVTSGNAELVETLARCGAPIFDPVSSLPFMDFFKGWTAPIDNNKTVSHFTSNNPRIRSLLYLFMAEQELMKNNLVKAIECFEQSSECDSVHAQRYVDNVVLYKIGFQITYTESLFKSLKDCFDKVSQTSPIKEITRDAFIVILKNLGEVKDFVHIAKMSRLGKRFVADNWILAVKRIPNIEKYLGQRNIQLNNNKALAICQMHGKIKIDLQKKFQHLKEIDKPEYLLYEALKNKEIEKAFFMLSTGIVTHFTSTTCMKFAMECQNKELLILLARCNAPIPIEEKYSKISQLPAAKFFTEWELAKNNNNAVDTKETIQSVISILRAEEEILQGQVDEAKSHFNQAINHDSVYALKYIASVTRGMPGLKIAYNQNQLNELSNFFDSILKVETAPGVEGPKQ